MVDSAPNLSDISMIIRQKERELHDIHERRCIQLEKTIEERDKAVNDLSKKFSLLRDDFKYNLSLLEARDNEIRRLETVGNSLNGHVQTLQTEKTSLLHRLEKLQAREEERKERAKGDAAMQKQMLLELQQEVEAVKWATAEEVKTKQSELDKCRETIRHMHTERENALSLQRRDMTSAFEQLVHQREAAFSQKEQEIAAQIASLEKRVEAAQTDNMRLKAELSDVSRQRDRMTLDAERRDETIRQLQWKMDDSAETWKRKEDALERSLHEALNEVNLCRDSLMKQIGDSQLEIDRARMEHRRERDLREAAEEKNKEMRAVMEERVKEARAAAEERMRQAGAATEDRVGEMRKEHLRENERLAAQLSSAEASADALKVQLAAAESQVTREKILAEAQIKSLNELIEKDRGTIAGCKEELSGLERQLQSSMDGSSKRIADLEAALAQREQEKAEQASEMRVRIAQLEGQVADMRSNQADELELHKAAMDAELILNSEEQESSRFAQHLQELQSKVMSVSSERDRLRGELQDFKAQLEEQTMECSALRLRLQLSESNMGASQRGLGGSAYQKAGNLVHPSALSPNFRQEYMNSGSRMDFPSPLFTEDQGSISIPGSPDGRFLNSGPPSRFGNNNVPDGYDGREGFYPSSGSGVPPLHGGMPPAPARRYSDPNSSSDSLAKLAEDNNRLREVIKEMRREMETLQAAHGENSFAGDKDRIIHEKNEKIAELESQLGQSLKEIARLRAERKKLMDVGNELRASLFHLQSKAGSPRPHGSSPAHSLEASPYSDHGSRGVTAPTGFSGGRAGQGSQGHLPVDNPWGHVEHRGEPNFPPPPPAPSEGGASDYRSDPHSRHSDNTVGTRYGGNGGRNASASDREGQFGDSEGVEGEPLALTALPLPPSRHSSNRTTDSQKRVLQRLKQTQMRNQEPRKVMNYASSALHHS